MRLERKNWISPVYTIGSSLHHILHFSFSYVCHNTQLFRIHLVTHKWISPVLTIGSSPDHLHLILSLMCMSSPLTTLPYPIYLGRLS